MMTAAERMRKRSPCTSSPSTARLHTRDSESARRVSMHRGAGKSMRQVAEPAADGLEPQARAPAQPHAMHLGRCAGRLEREKEAEQDARSAPKKLLR